MCQHTHSVTHTVTHAHTHTRTLWDSGHPLRGLPHEGKASARRSSTQRGKKEEVTLDWDLLCCYIHKRALRFTHFLATAYGRVRVCAGFVLRYDWKCVFLPLHSCCACQMDKHSR